MATRRERIDALLTKLVDQLERKVGAGDLMEADARVLLQLHKQAVGYEEPDADGKVDFTDRERQVIHDLAREK